MSNKDYDSEWLKKEVVKLLEANSQGLNINQIAQHLKINRNTISKCLKILETQNMIISRRNEVSTIYFTKKKFKLI